VEFCELLAPRARKNGVLICDEMKLGEPDASGRRSPVPTGKTVELPCTALIFATGESVDNGFFSANGIDLTAKGRAAVDGLLQTNIDGVYVIGDANRGPATVVEAIADARKVADAILGSYAYEIPACAKTCTTACYEKQGKLDIYDSAEKEANRCLACSTVCECCVQVCPNRANLSIKVKGIDMPQILHIDKMCNECGNCLVFCPYDSRPYKEKLTLFSTKEEFNGSDNPGFFHLGGHKFLLRTAGQTESIDLDAPKELDPDIEKILFAVLTDYAYLLG